MIVEFISTPGAGKTTLLPTVADFLNERGYCARAVIDAARPLARRTVVGRAVGRLAPPAWQRALLWQTFYRYSQANQARFIARNPELVGMVWRFQWRRPIAQADRRHVLRWFSHQTGVYEFLRRRAEPDEAILFDEGFIHRVVQLFASENEMPEPGAVAAYINRLPRPDLVIHPVAPREICERRVYGRGLWERFQVKSAEETSRFIASAERAVNLAVGLIKQQGWTVIEVDNSGDDPSIARAELWRALAQTTSDELPVPRGQRPLTIDYCPLNTE